MLVAEGVACGLTSSYRLTLEVGQLGFDSLGVCGPPKDSTAIGASREALLSHIDIRWYLLFNRLSADFAQQSVASRAAGERTAVGVDREAEEDFMKLLPNPLGGEVERIGRGS